MVSVGRKCSNKGPGNLTSFPVWKLARARARELRVKLTCVYRPGGRQVRRESVSYVNAHAPSFEGTCVSIGPSQVCLCTSQRSYREESASMVTQKSLCTGIESKETAYHTSTRPALRQGGAHPVKGPHLRIPSAKYKCVCGARGKLTGYGRKGSPVRATPSYLV